MTILSYTKWLAHFLNVHNEAKGPIEYINDDVKVEEWLMRRRYCIFLEIL